LFGITVVPTGLANIASVLAAFERIGIKGRISEDRRHVREAAALVLPGVGAFGAGMKRIRELGLEDELRTRVIERRPILAVCLGMQLLAEASDETPGVSGISVIPGTVGRFSTQAGLRVPQLGWNRVEAKPGAALVQTGFAYFANSYCIRSEPEGFTAAYADYDGRFVAAFEDGPVLACQFHPELSGGWGQALIHRWCDVARES
jgi:imidazole glycerol-phosphate synthase subunit HisH